MSNGHAFLPPSRASSWSKCSMWPAMNRQFPQDDSVEGIEGTAAHWVGWEIFANRPVTVGMKTPSGPIVTDEMIEGGQLLADTIRERIPLALPPFGFQIEQPIPVPSISSHCFGTPDLWALSSTVQLEIIDYKFGHRFVDEFWNPQGLSYLSGIIDFLVNTKRIPDDMWKWMHVSFTVVQPRCFYKGKSVRTHNFQLMSSETQSRFSHLAKMAELALAPEPTATTNEHCGDCPGRHACSALQFAAYNDFEYSDARTPLRLSPTAAALELRILTRALDRLKARVEGLQEQTLSNIRAGHPVNYFRAEPGFGRQQWTIPDEQVITIGKLYGQDLSKPGVITPKQAQTAGIAAEIIKGFSFVPSTGFRLIAVNPTDAPRTFGRIEEQE